MNRLIIFIALLQILPDSSAIAQDNFTLIDGIIIDAKTKEGLVGASIRLSGTSTGTRSDAFGHFSFKFPKSTQADSLVVTYVGYKKYAVALANLKIQSGLQIRMTDQATTLKEVVVRSEFWLKQYSPDELQEDYKKFYTIMEKTHTGLFDYLSEREWQALKDSALQLCKYPMSHSEFYRLIALHVGKVRNTHTRHGVTDWWYRQKQNIFPFNIKYFDDKLYVSESLVKDLAFPKGTQILEINGNTPKEIKAMIWPYIPADGYIQSGRMAALNDYFPWYFSLFVEEAETYHIKLKTLAGRDTLITTPGLRDAFSHLSFQQLWKWKKSSLELRIDDKLETAYFRIEDSHAFKDSIRTYFKRIRDHGVKYLIIDLRTSKGIEEEEHVTKLYSYLITEPSMIYEPIQVKSNDHTLFDKDYKYKTYANSLKQLKESYLDKLVDSGHGYYYWKKEPYLELIKPASIQFTGTVYILADGRNYSASTDFTSIASQLDNVFVVGEETGGEYRSYISGAMFGLELPNSNIGIKIPTWKSTLAIKENPSNRGRGVIPDYPVSESLEDFIKGTDAVKKFAYELISQKRK